MKAFGFFQILDTGKTVGVMGKRTMEEVQNDAASRDEEYLII